ncbi:unnamed protein product [Lactuca saligna]|uniref:Uncharacterized protein n=1 Tax=Lactuca saligna TaxID=75948 RepID=A0AA36ERQ8_LACSI|nr:unnamed protein product [Lactuca saligna]
MKLFLLFFYVFILHLAASSPASSLDDADSSVACANRNITLTLTADYRNFTLPLPADADEASSLDDADSSVACANRDITLTADYRNFTLPLPADADDDCDYNLNVENRKFSSTHNILPFLLLTMFLVCVFVLQPNKENDFLDLEELDISQSQSIDDDKRVHGGMLFPFLEGKDLQSTENPIPMVEEDGLLSKNRKLEGFLGRECNSDSSHKSSGEQQLAIENVNPNQSKAARANSHDECAKDEMMNMDKNSEAEDVEHNHPKVDIQDENAGGDFTTVSLTSTSCLSKQGDKDFATWPHRNVEDQISISQSQSDDIIQSRVDDEMLVGFLKRKNSLHELQAIEPTFTEVEHEQSGPTWVKSAASESDQTRIDGGVEFQTLELPIDCKSARGSSQQTSLLSRIRELLGNPSKNKTSEQQLKSSHEDFDACTSTETMNIDLDLDLNPLVEESLLPKNRMVEDVEHSPKVSLHDDAAAVYCEPAFTEVESAASESDQTSNGDVDFTLVGSHETVTPVSKFSSTQHQVEDFYYEDMDISSSADYEDMDISTSADYDLVTISDYSYPTQQQTDDSLPPFNTWHTKHFCSSPVDLGNLWDNSTSTTENPFGDLTSFVPHPQKQAAAVWPGRRGDIKVKALVAAKAAKIRQEKQENERNRKKEAFRMEIARRKREKQKEGKAKKGRRKWFLEA